METEMRERIYSAKQAKQFAAKVNFDREVLTYILVHRLSDAFCPFYVGTAKSKSRIDNHARKANGVATLTRKSNHIEFAKYVERQAKIHGPEWIGFCIYRHSSHEQAQDQERALIAKFGLKKEPIKCGDNSEKSLDCP